MLFLLFKKPLCSKLLVLNYSNRYWADWTRRDFLRRKEVIVMLQVANDNDFGSLLPTVDSAVSAGSCTNCSGPCACNCRTPDPEDTEVR